VNKYKKRLTKVTKEQNAEARQLLTLMGVPIVEAPGEAEAQCAAMAKADLVYGVATEDMDALTFGTPRLLRHLTFSASRKEPIVEIDLASILQGMALTMDQFIDFCVLCGCDYTTTIRGIGPTTALKLIQTHGSLAEALKHIDKTKHAHGDEFMPIEAAELFRTPDVTPPDQIKLEWKDPDEDGLVQFLVTEKGFSLERVQSALKRLRGARQKASQQRMEGFFKAPAPAAAAAAAGASSSSSSASAAAASSAPKPIFSTTGEAPIGIVYEKMGKRKEAPVSAGKKQGGLTKKAKAVPVKKASTKKK
jgi:flap endonuclease-1